MPTKDTTKTGTSHELIARIAEQERKLAELKAQIARGTGDLTEQAQRVTLAARIESKLRERPHTLEDLAREMGEPVGRVSSALRPLKRHLYNAGTAEAPAWFWIVGDKSSATEINAAVAALVRFKPMTLTELLAATGGRQSRVSGAVIVMQRDSKSRIVNLGNTTRARWFVVPEGVKIARLARP